MQQQNDNIDRQQHSGAGGRRARVPVAARAQLSRMTRNPGKK